MALQFFNTLTKTKEEFKPIKEGEVSIYTCGPTVYFPMHIGNIRAYANSDILHRTLLFLGYDVKRYINFTDVGHMSSTDDYGSDFGEDKIEASAKKEGLKPLDIANRYINSVMEDFAQLNYLNPDGSTPDPSTPVDKLSGHNWVRATDYIQEMIDMTKEIEKNGYTYETDQAVYFDVTKLEDYTIFTGQDLSDKIVGAREEVGVDPDKKNPADFVLWMKLVGKYEDHLMKWESPWGVGFPGWHIECSAMGCAKHGENFDIHTGGIDHIPVHHTNERAQNIGTFGHPVVNVWLHNEFLHAKDGEKLSKSKGNSWELVDLAERGYDPLDLRYYFASIHYRQPISLSEEGLKGARNSRLKIVNKLLDLADKAGVGDTSDIADAEVVHDILERFTAALEDDLNVSVAFAILFELIGSDHAPKSVIRTSLEMDRVLGLRLADVIDGIGGNALPEEVKALLEERQKARDEKDYRESDFLRSRIEELGYLVKDTGEGQKVFKDDSIG